MTSRRTTLASLAAALAFLATLSPLSAAQAAKGGEELAGFWVKSRGYGFGVPTELLQIFPTGQYRYGTCEWTFNSVTAREMCAGNGAKLLRTGLVSLKDGRVRFDPAPNDKLPAIFTLDARGQQQGPDGTFRTFRISMPGLLGKPMREMEFSEIPPKRAPAWTSQR